MAATTRLFLVGGFMAIAAGFAWALFGNLSDWGVNAAGLAPSALIGFAMVSLGTYSLWTSRLIRTRQQWWLPLPAVLAVLVVVSIYSMVTNEARPHEFSPPLNYVVGTGYAVSRATSTIALAFGVMLAGVFALSAVVDLVPAFRRRGAGAAFRRILWPIFKEPGTSPSRRR